MTSAHDTSTFAHHIGRWVDAFNRGDLHALDSLYEDQGVLVPVPGHPVTGADRAAANGHFVGLGATMRADLRRGYVAGDIALLIVDWSITGVNPDGTEFALTGTATDVLRQGADGSWRVVIDNPSGVS